MPQQTIPSHRLAFLFLMGYAFLLLFILSTDSYTHDLFPRVDSACFFTAGKAWMNGMVPYVEFTDSKGPLLWLIYGIGYLISHHDYIGVFWISCLWYSFTFYYMFLTAEVFLADKRSSLLCAATMSIAFFFPYIHRETRSEDFSHLFMAISLYHTSLLLYGRNVSKKTIHRAFMALGISFGALLMMKYSIAAIQLVFILFAVYYLLKEHQPMIRAFLMLGLGMLAVMMPFIIYLLCYGCFDDFIKEYFFLTSQTITHQGNVVMTIFKHVFNYATTNPVISIEMAVILIGAVFYGIHLQRYRLFPLIVVLWVMGMSLIGQYDYYLSINATSFIFAALMFVTAARRIPSAIYLPTVFATTCLLAIFINKSPHEFFWRGGKLRTDYYNVAYLISRVDHPTLLNLGCLSYGLETLPDALPSNKYWIYQNGSIPQMTEAHLKDLYERKADFLCVRTKKIGQLHLKKGTLKALGYHPCYEWNIYSEHFILFTKHDVHLSSTDITPSSLDILTKKVPAWLSR